jgi:Flp pilus assembly pilin Flp
MLEFIPQLAKSKRGATAIEYALIALLIAVVCVGAFGTFGDSSAEMWNYVESNIAP